MRHLEPFQTWRLTVFQAVVFGVFLIFSLQLYQYQVAEQDFWELLADDNRLNRLPIPAPRGIVLDRYDQPMAINVPAYNVTIVPAGLPADQGMELEIFNRISALTGVPPTAEIRISQESNLRSIEELVADGEGVQPFAPVVVAQDIPQEVAQQILEERVFMSGVDISVAAVREYPDGELTSHIIGYMGPVDEEEAEELRDLGFDPRFERTGYDGIELFLQNYLEGERGSILREVDVAGREVQVLEQIEPIPGENLRLTIDVELQRVAEQALVDELTRVNTQAGRIVTQQGVVIAMDPSTGEILSLVSTPSYDNRRFARFIDAPYYFDVADDPLRPLVNQAIRSLYPPGSVWKLITAVGVIHEDVIDPRTTLQAPGVLFLENRYARNDRAQDQRFVCWIGEPGHGAVDMIQGIAQSCDIYYYLIGGGNPELPPSVLKPGGLGITDLFRHATAFGIGSELGIELPSELRGRMPDPDWKRRTYGENWSTGDTYNASFGQGYLTTTPLQLLNATAAVVNNGTLYQPTVIRDFLDGEENVTVPFEPSVLRSVNLDAVPPGETPTLLLLEDMIMKGENSLACTCEGNSPFYNENRCDPQNYRNTVDIDDDPLLIEPVEYKVHIPLNYSLFFSNVCDANRFDSDYQPPFPANESLSITREGMRATVTIGTAQAANLSYVETAGKTGTAEYCDDIARPLGLCRPGNWPAHAWYTGYAPVDDPEILVIAFAYNGGEGSAVALPVVVKTMEAYFRLQNERGESNIQVTGQEG